MELTKALESLGHPRDAFAALDSIQPRETSIIDVATLHGLDDASAEGAVKLRSEAGHEIALPRPIIAALTAELMLTMAQTPRPIFKHSDLLDFPGVRERNTAQGPLERYLDKGESPKKELFLRGKVAFLFERYVAEQELTSMLLCVPPSNINVAADLSAGVEEWISKTQGATPDERAQVETMLFLVLTKFDEHLIKKAGEGEPHQRFQNRFEASLLAPFGNVRDSWPKNWTPGKPFNNCYWLRNPKYPAETAIKYEDGIEVGYVEHNADYIDRLKEGSKKSELAQTHMKDPAVAWDAAMVLKDGGVSYLVKNLTSVSRPEIKAQQITARHIALKEAMAQRVAPFYSDSDVEKRLEERRAAATDVIQSVNDAFDVRKFGRLIEGLTVNADDIAARIDQLPENIVLVSTDSSSGIRGAGAPGGRRRNIPGTVAGSTPSVVTETDPNEEKTRVMTREAFQAETATLVWLSSMRTLAARSNLETYLHMSAAQVSEIISELSSAARRMSLIERVAVDLRRWNFGARSDGQAAAASLVASQSINRLVERLGVDEMTAEQRPLVPAESGDRPAFQPLRRPASPFELPEAPHRHDEEYLDSWTYALYRLFEDNALSVDEGTLNQEQNVRLGDILGSLGHSV